LKLTNISIIYIININPPMNPIEALTYCFDDSKNVSKSAIAQVLTGLRDSGDAKYVQKIISTLIFAEWPVNQLLKNVKALITAIPPKNNKTFFEEVFKYFDTDIPTDVKNRIIMVFIPIYIDEFTPDGTIFNKFVPIFENYEDHRGEFKSSILFMRKKINYFITWICFEKPKNCIKILNDIGAVMTTNKLDKFDNFEFTANEIYIESQFKKSLCVLGRNIIGNHTCGGTHTETINVKFLEKLLHKYAQYYIFGVTTRENSDELVKKYARDVMEFTDFTIHVAAAADGTIIEIDKL